MKIGIGLPNPLPTMTDGRLIVKWARRAEERGFSSLATIDRIAYPSHESLVALAAAGAVTERIGLVTNVLLGPTRPPLLLAKEAASIDAMTGGRLTLGLGVGSRPDDFDAAERPFAARGKDMDAALERMHRAWRGEPLEEGGHRIAPPTTREEGVPILIGGASDRSIERTVRWGVGWTAGGSPPEQVGPFAERVRRAWKDAGKAGQPRLVALFYFSMGDEAESRENLRHYYSYLGEWTDAIVEGAARGADAVRDRVRAYADIGIDEVILDPTVADLAEVDRLADAVL